jgi:hypothetical protein
MLDIHQKRYLAGMLELACQQLELTESQYEDAKSKYKAVSNWLGDSLHFTLGESYIFPHGSIRLGTTVRPLGRDEFDIDLVCKIKYASGADNPDEIRNLVGERLREKETYAEMLEPLNRGWRLNYAESSKFHLDITPAISNHGCTNGGLLVPDKERKEWKPTNPQGYAEVFDECAKLLPPHIMDERIVLKAEIDPLPDQIPIKGLLKRIVQICKRHRDMMFVDDTQKRAPISVIITTLAAQSYVDVVKNTNYTHELDLIYAVIAKMHDYIQRYEVLGKPFYVIPNPTTEGENFAEKWNSHPERAGGFFAWRKKALHDFDELAKLDGIDNIIGYLKQRIIGPESARVLNLVTQRTGNARSTGLLKAAPVVIGLNLTQGHTIKANTFYGS